MPNKTGCPLSTGVVVQTSLGRPASGELCIVWLRIMIEGEL